MVERPFLLFEGFGRWGFDSSLWHQQEVSNMEALIAIIWISILAVITVSMSLPYKRPKIKGERK